MSAPPSPSGEPSEAGRGVPAGLTLVIVVMMALRLIVAGQVHLTEDEAYYRLWSMAPALGYYDHPPMIAWWIWLGRHIAADNALGVRLIPILGSAVTSLLVFDMARLAGANRRLAGQAGVWFNAMWLVAAGGFLATPDAPASLFWASGLWAALRAMRGPAIRWWLAAGAAAGLACLSKYSSLFLAPGMVLWLAWTREGRAVLRTPGPWLAAAIAVAIFGFNVEWNATHGWLTFHKQFGRVAASRFATRYLAEFLGGQFLLLNPLIAIFAGAGTWRALRREDSPIDLTAFVATSAPLIAYLLIHSLHDRVEAHWPAPIYPALAVCAAAGAESLKGLAIWRRLATAAPIAGFVAVGALLAWLAAPPAGLADPAAPVRGWPVFARRLESLRHEAGAAWVGTTSYGLASELADEPALAAPVFQIRERDRWTALRRPAPDLTRPGLAVDLSRRTNAASLGRCFTSVQYLGALTRADDPQPYAVFAVANPAGGLLAKGC